LLQIPNVKDICPVIIETLQPFYCDGAFFMAKEKKSFILYADQQGVFNQLPDEIAGRLIKHIFAYVNDEQPVTDELIINIAFEPIKQCLKRDLCRWKEYLDKQSVNGKKGGRPKKPNESEITQAFSDKPKKADSVSVSVNESVNVNDKEEYTPFETIWTLYGKVGNRKTSLEKWTKFKLEDRKQIESHIPLYIKNHSDNDKLSFLPHLTTYLTQKRWLDELPYKQHTKPFTLRNQANLNDD
jgi:hypothetical protein